MPSAEPQSEPSACVFAPAVMLTVTVESGADEQPEVHLHAGGQGFWIARLMVELGVDVVVVGPFGGEVGGVLQSLVEASGARTRVCTTGGSNGVYVHDRRSGERVVVAEMPPTPLTRHEVDELYGSVLVEALDADVCVLAGPGLHPVIPAEFYERLAHDVRGGGTPTVADLSGDCRDHALRGGLSVLKVAVEELRRDGWDGSDEDDDVARCLHELAGAGADAVVATRAERGALALVDGEVMLVESPALQPAETRGAGDSLTAGLAAAVARGEPLTDALRLGAAAGALNVTRRGLGSGVRDDIERFVEQVEVRSVDGGGSS